MDDLETRHDLSVALPESVSRSAEEHLLKHFRRDEAQEDVCLALWRPSKGNTRFCGLISELFLPELAERELRGNVTLEAEYLARVASIARERGTGVAIMHSHPTAGWQGMSRDDVETEHGRAGFVFGATGLPLLGMTLGVDGAWSARFWQKTAPKTFARRWCRSVRVVGTRLTTTFHPRLDPPFKVGDELRRPVSVWGTTRQQDMSRLHVGIVGLGSVGRMVSEGLARMGVGRVSLIDFDHVQLHNLDRLIGASRKHASNATLKVDLAREGYLSAASVADPQVKTFTTSVVELDGYRAALDCDVLFSCVDRNWPRRVLNHLAYAHLIPVIDGGIRARFSGGTFRGVEWSLRTSAPGRRCLKCAGAYEPGFIELERSGQADDPKYIAGLPTTHQLRSAENIFSFSMCLAGQELLQFVGLVTGIRNKPDFGEQRYYYNLGELRSEHKSCDDSCAFPELVATGDSVYGESMLTGIDPAAHKQINTVRR